MSDLFNHLASVFTTEDERNFVRKFHRFLDNDPLKDFVVDIDEVWEYVGLHSKAYTKKVLQRRFVLDTDYKIMETQHVSQTVENIREYTRTKMVTTPNGFIELCIVANTYRSKQVRRYYAKMETVRREYLSFIYDQRMEKFRRKLEFRQHHVYEDGETIYVWDDDQGSLKVGSTDDMNACEDAFYSDTCEGAMVFTKRCQNKDVLETVVHHMLRNYAMDHPCIGWYNTQLTTIKDVIEKASAFLETPIDFKLEGDTNG